MPGMHIGLLCHKQEVGAEQTPGVMDTACPLNPALDNHFSELLEVIEEIRMF